MSNKNYIEKQVEDLIMSDEIFKSFKKEYKGKNILDKSIIQIATLLLRFVKYSKGNYNFSRYDYNKFNKTVIEMKEILSEEEKESFNNFRLLMDGERDYNRENVFIELFRPSYIILISKQSYIYQKIIILEEEKKINETLLNF